MNTLKSAGIVRHLLVRAGVFASTLAAMILLAIAVVPLALMTLYFALRARFEKHRRIARWTFPIWMYVSVTGVVIYLLLYQIFPQR